MSKPLIVTIQDLHLLNPSISLDKDGLRMKLSRGRDTPGPWYNYKSAADKRIVLIQYRDIDAKYARLKALPEEHEAAQLLADRKAALQSRHKAEQQAGAEAMHVERQLAQMVEDCYMKHISYYHGHYTGQNEKARLLAKEHALRLAVVALHRAGYSIKRQLHPAYLCLSQKSTVGNYTKFSQAIKEWAESVNLVHGHKGASRPERCKLTAPVVALIEAHYKHPNQYASPLITEMVNRECAAQGWPELSARTVRLYLARPDVHNRLLIFRNRAQFRKTVQATTRRKKAFHAGDLYYMDGSPLQIACAHPTIPGKQIRPTLFVVLDQHSGEVAGFSITPGGEDKLVWIAAMRMACDRKGALPAEWVYDNASATGTEEFKAIKEQMESMGCLLNPAKKGNPQAKANLERWFDSFQNGYQRLVDGFFGEGITSRRDNARIDAEWLRKVQKEGGQMTYDSLVELVTRLIAAYNQKPAPRRAAPSVAFAESEKPNMIALAPEKLATLFWKAKTIKVSNAEVKMTVRSVEYYYEVYEHSMALELAGQQVKVYYDEADLSTVHIFTLAGDYLAELRQKVAFAAARINQQAGDVPQIIKQTSHNKAIETVAKKLSREVADAAPEALVNVLNPLTVLKDEYNNAETELYLAYMRDSKTLDGDKVREYAPVAHTPQAGDKAAQMPDYSKRYAMPATLEIVGEQKR